MRKATGHTNYNPTAPLYSHAYFVGVDYILNGQI